MVVAVEEELSNLKNTNLCRRCHRKLKDEESIKLGFGRICYNKYKQSKKIYLFELEGGDTNGDRKGK